MFSLGIAKIQNYHNLRIICQAPWSIVCGGVTFVRNGFCPQGTISTIRWPQWDKDQIFKTFFFSYFYIIYRKQLLSSLTNVDNSLAALLVIDKIDSTHCHFHLNPFAFDSTEKSSFCCFVFDLWLLFSTAIWIYLHNGEQFQIIRFLITERKTTNT